MQEGIAPLIFQNLRLVPSGDSWYRERDAAAIYGEIYEGLPSAGSPAPVELRLRLVDGATGTVTPVGSTKLDGFRPGEFATIPFALKFSAAALPAGRYRIEAEAVASTGQPVTRSLSFEVR